MSLQSAIETIRGDHGVGPRPKDDQQKSHASKGTQHAQPFPGDCGRCEQTLIPLEYIGLWFSFQKTPGLSTFLPLSIGDQPLSFLHGESSRYVQQDDGRFSCNFRAIQQAQTRHSRRRHLKHHRTAASHASSDGAIDAIRAIVLIPKSIPFRPHQLEEGGLVHNSFIARIVNGYVQVDQSRVCACSFLLADTDSRLV